MAPKELLALRLLIDHTDGLYGSQFVRLSDGKLSRGTVYSLLARMVDKGYVREIEDPPTDVLQLARTRHVITAKGQAAFNGFLSDCGLQTVPLSFAG